MNNNTYISFKKNLLNILHFISLKVFCFFLIVSLSLQVQSFAKDEVIIKRAASFLENSISKKSNHLFFIDNLIVDSKNPCLWNVITYFEDGYYGRMKYKQPCSLPPYCEQMYNYTFDLSKLDPNRIKVDFMKNYTLFSKEKGSISIYTYYDFHKIIINTTDTAKIVKLCFGYNKENYKLVDHIDLYISRKDKREQKEYIERILKAIKTAVKECGGQAGF